MEKENKKKGRHPMTEEEKQEREIFLKNETIENRTKRVLNPRIKSLLRNFDMLISSLNSARYKLSDEQKTNLLITVQNRITLLETASTKTKSKEEIEDIL